MSTETTFCAVCETEFEIDKYGEGVCPKCNQVYSYDEGYSLILTEEQRQLLLEHSRK